MPSPMPGRTRTVLASLSSCAMAAFPVLKPARRSHYMISGLAQCSFALRPARSLTPFKGAFSIEGSGRLVASSPAPIATGWSEICRVGLYPLPLGVLRLSHGAPQQSRSGLRLSPACSAHRVPAPSSGPLYDRPAAQDSCLPGAHRARAVRRISSPEHCAAQAPNS